MSSEAPRIPWPSEFHLDRRSAMLLGLAAAGSLAMAPRTPAAAAETPTVLRINAGGPAVTAGGVAWTADQYFSGGKSFTNPSVTA
ncbi:hypothetical protein HER39_06115, partial [Arthrobacter deserti]|nr:hypothetical protein [Arthrobacter deserti]